MPTYTTEVEVDIDVDLDDFKDEELVEELLDRGYAVLDGGENHWFEAAVAALRQGRKEEGFILLERCLPELKGLLV